MLRRSHATGMGAERDQVIKVKQTEMDRLVMKHLFVVMAALVCGVALAVPPAVEKVAEEMIADGADVRAASTEKLGVFVVASSSVPITTTANKAANVAKLYAEKSLAGFLNAQVDAYESAEMVSDGDEVKEFFHSVTKTKVKELLKGVQTLKSYQNGDEMVCIVYMTTRGVDKAKEFEAARDAMGDNGTVEAVGEASNRDAALQKALRNAVEQVLGTMLVGEASAKSMEEVASKIFTSQQGLVDEYRITGEVEVAVGVRITVLAKVSKGKLLESYRTYMKALGDPAFYIASNSPDLTSQFNQFFMDMGIRMTANRSEATYVIDCFGDYNQVRNPVNGRKGIQLSLRFKVKDANGSEVHIDMENDPSKNSSFIGSGEVRQKQICSKAAFKQMKEPLHKNIQAMITKLMDRHTDAVMQADD